MVKKGALKYFRTDNGKGWPDQLYDLRTDPEERQNLVNTPEYANALEELRALLTELPDPGPKV